MAHEVYGQRFYGGREQPFWHSLGIVNGLKQTAQQTWEQMKYRVIKSPMLRAYDMTETGKVAILRLPSEDDPVVRQFGFVDQNYYLITPDELVQVLDEKFGEPVETMVALKSGLVFVVSFLLPQISVKGDEIDRYLVVSNRMDGKTAFNALETDVRVGCANTLAQAEHRYQSRFRIHHYDGAAVEIAKWFVEARDAFVAKTQLIQEAYDVLANKPIDLPAIKGVSEKVYPMPKKPDLDKPRKTEIDRILAKHEYRVERVKKARESVLDLYGGKDPRPVPAELRGTAYHALNSFATFETFKRGPEDSAAESLLVGDRASNIRRAFHWLQKA